MRMPVQVSPPRRGAAALAAQYGEGARIYVGGVPDLVSVNMVRSHFSRWGQVHNAAVDWHEGIMIPINAITKHVT